MKNKVYVAYGKLPTTGETVSEFAFSEEDVLLKMYENHKMANEINVVVYIAKAAVFL